MPSSIRPHARLLLLADLHSDTNLPHARVNADATSSDRLEDVMDILAQCREIAQEDGLYGARILGDLFDKRHPDAPTLIRTAAALRDFRLDDTGAVVRDLGILPGNHDAHDRQGKIYSLDLYTELQIEGLKTMSHGDSETFGDVVIWYVPWLPDKLFRERVQEITDVAAKIPEKRHLLFIHQPIRGARDGTHVLTSGVDFELFKPFHLVLSGHVHQHQKWVLPPTEEYDFETTVMYLGAPMHFRFTDAGEKRYVWILDTETLTLEKIHLYYCPFISFEIDLDYCDDLEEAHDKFSSWCDAARADMVEDYPYYGRVRIKGTRSDVNDVSKWIRDQLESTMGSLFRSVKLELEATDDGSSTRVAAVTPKGTKAVGVTATAADALTSAYAKASRASHPEGATEEDIENAGLACIGEARASTKRSSGGRVRFKHIEGECFGVLRNRWNIPLEDLGMTLVLGVNKDSRAANSNGAGKTTVFRAISWALFGTTVDGMKTDEVIHRGEKKAKVYCAFEVTAADGSVAEYLVYRDRTAKTGTLRFWRKDPETGIVEDMTLGTSKMTQEAIESTLGMDWETFRTTVLFGQGDHARFASPHIGDAARKDVLGRVLDLSRFDAARQIAKDAAAREAGAAAEIGKEIARLESELAGAKNRRDVAVAKLEAMQDADEAREEADKRMKEALALGDKVVEQRKQADEADEAARKIAEGISELEEERNEVSKALDVVNTRLGELSAERKAAKAKADALATAGACPACGQDRPYDADAHDRAVEEVEEIEDQIKSFEEKRDRGRRTLAEIDTDLRDERSKHRTKVAEASILRSSANSDEKAKARLLDEYERLLDEADKLAERAKMLEDERAAAVAEISDLESDIAEKVAVRDEHEATGALYSWWARVGFGPKGVPAFAIERALPILNEKANRHLSVLADGDIRVTWTATTEGKSGKDKEELTLNVWIEGHEDVTPSGGQQKKIELATEVALSEIMRDTDGLGAELLMLDEALDGLDAEGRSRVGQWLSTLGASTILVVSHDDEVAESFDNVIVITKSDGHSLVTEGGTSAT